MFANLSFEQLTRVICATAFDSPSSNGTERNPWDLSLALVQQAGQLRLTFFQIKASATSEGSGTDFSPHGKQQLAQQLSKMLFTVIQIAAGCDLDLGKATVELIAQKTAQHLDQACSHKSTDCCHQQPLSARRRELQLPGTTSVPQAGVGESSKRVNTSSAITSMAVPEAQQQLQQQTSRGMASGIANAASPTSNTDNQHSLGLAVQHLAKNINNGSSMCRSSSASAVPPPALLPANSAASSPGDTADSSAVTSRGIFNVQQQQQQCAKPARGQDTTLNAETSSSAAAAAAAAAAEAPSSYDSVASILSAADEVVLPVGKSSGFMNQHLTGGVLGAGGGVLGVQMPHASAHNDQSGPASRGGYISSFAELSLPGDCNNVSASTAAASASAAGTLWLTGAVSPDVQGAGSCGSSNSTNSQQSGSLISPCGSDSSTWSTTAALSSVLRSGALQNPRLMRHKTQESLGALHPWQDSRTRSNTTSMSYNMLGANGNNAVLSQQRGVPGAMSLQNLDLAGLGLLSGSSDAAAVFAAARLGPAAAMSSPAAKLAAVASLSAMSPLPSPMPGSLGLSAPTPYVSHGISSSCITNSVSSGAMSLTPNLNLAAAAAARVASDSPIVNSLSSSASRFLSLDSGVIQPPGMLQQSPLLCKPESATTTAATACCSRCGGSHYGKCPPRAKCIRCYRKAHLGECWTRCVRCNLVHAPDKCKARPQQQIQQQVELLGVRRADTA